MTTDQSIHPPPNLRSVLMAPVCLLPLALLLLAFAAGVVIPFWLYLLVLLRAGGRTCAELLRG